MAYGPEGIGKSTFAAHSDRPVFVQTEDGLAGLDCDRFPLASSYGEVITALDDLATEDHPFRTVVIDSLSALERLIFDEVCRESGVSSIEKADGGFARGYTHALTYWREVLTRLDRLRNQRGMAIVLIAHAKVERYEDPELSAYDRYARCHPPLPEDEVDRIAASIARYEPDGTSVAVTEHHWDQMREEAEKSEDDSVGTSEDDPGPLPVHLLHAPGFISEVMDYTLDTAPYPEPVLAFCGALTLQAFLAGRKVRDQRDNRTNLYVLGLANSGAGKEHPRKVNQRILYHTGMAECVGDGFASGEGIEDRMLLTPAVLFQTDEIDGLMSKINSGKESRHESIMNVLLKMYTSGASFYPMRVKAGREHSVIDQPSLTIFGTAIPSHYYEALSIKMLSNGFFARMLIFEAGKRGAGRDGKLLDVPDRVMETARYWADLKPGRQGNLSDWHPVPNLVPSTDGADAVIAELREEAESHYGSVENVRDNPGMAIWARALEKAIRLGLIHACSKNHQNPVIEEEGLRWAWRIVEHQTRRMLFMVGAHVSESEHRCKAVLATLRNWKEKHGPAWMPFWKLSRRHPWTEREHEDVRGTLLNQRLIEYLTRKTGGTPQRLYRLA